MEAWFEDRITLGLEIKYIQSESLGGIAFFMLGYDDSRLGEYFLDRRTATFLSDFLMGY